MRDINYLKSEHVTLDEKSNYNVSWVEAVLIDSPNSLGINKLEFIKKYKCEETCNNSTLLFDWSNGRHRFIFDIQSGCATVEQVYRIICNIDNAKKESSQFSYSGCIIAEFYLDNFVKDIKILRRNYPIAALELRVLEINNTGLLLFEQILSDWAFDDAMYDLPF